MLLYVCLRMVGLGLRLWLLILCSHPMGSFVLRVEGDSNKTEELSVTCANVLFGNNKDGRATKKITLANLQNVFT